MELYLVVIGKTPTGYSAHCPNVPGCAAVGKTIGRVVANMKDALELHFEGLLDDGEPLPKPDGVEAYRDAMKDPGLENYLLAHVPIEAKHLAAVV